MIKKNSQGGVGGYQESVSRRTTQDGGEFEALKMKETEKLNEYYMKPNGLVTNIRALREKIEETYMVKNCFEQYLQNFYRLL